MVARACASIAAMLDVADIVIGGIVPSVFGTPFFDALARELDQRSGLDHLESLRIRGTGIGRVGPLVAAAAVAKLAQAERAAEEADLAAAARDAEVAPTASSTAATDLPDGNHAN